MTSDSGDFGHRLGERLRAIRVQQGLTLQQVEERSQGHWKAVVVGSYERGARAVSAAKLAELAGFYGVPLAELLPEGSAPPPQRQDESRVVIDLVKLATVHGDPALQPLSRLAARIQSQRGDYNGRVLTLRSADIESVAIVTGVDRTELVERLQREAVITAVI